MSEDEKEIQEKKIFLMKSGLTLGLIALAYFAARIERIIDLLSK